MNISNYGNNTITRERDRPNRKYRNPIYSVGTSVAVKPPYTTLVLHEIFYASSRTGFVCFRTLHRHCYCGFSCKSIQNWSSNYLSSFLFSTAYSTYSWVILCEPLVHRHNVIIYKARARENRFLFDTIYERIVLGMSHGTPRPLTKKIVKRWRRTKIVRIQYE